MARATSEGTRREERAEREAGHDEREAADDGVPALPRRRHPQWIAGRHAQLIAY